MKEIRYKTIRFFRSRVGLWRTTNHCSIEGFIITSESIFASLVVIWSMLRMHGLSFWFLSFIFCKMEVGLLWRLKHQYINLLYYRCSNLGTRCALLNINWIASMTSWYNKFHVDVIVFITCKSERWDIKK